MYNTDKYNEIVNKLSYVKSHCPIFEIIIYTQCVQNKRKTCYVQHIILFKHSLTAIKSKYILNKNKLFPLK